MPVQIHSKNKIKPFLTFGRFFPKQVVALVSDRSLDFARSNADPEVELKREEFLREHLGMGREKIFPIKQVHGKHVVNLRNSWVNSIRDLQEADGIITKDLVVPLAVRTADCLSVFIFDPKCLVIGLVHAGWRGTKEKIVTQALKLIEEEWGSSPRDLKVALGPCIRSCCYRVGREFKEFFPRDMINKKDGLYLDLPQANINQLIDFGVAETNILDCSICTCCDERFFSHRQEGEKAGRMISLMMLKSS